MAGPSGLTIVVFPAFRQEASIKEEKTTPLRQRMIEDMDIRGLCAKTQKAHIRNVKRTLENCPDRAAGVESRRHSAVGGLTMAQMGFFDLSERHARLDAKRDPLIEIDAIVPWEEFRPALEQVWREPEGERKSRAGRKPMDAVVMFKTLVLGALYNLSDDQIEYQVRWKRQRATPALTAKQILRPIAALQKFVQQFPGNRHRPRSSQEAWTKPQLHRRSDTLDRGASLPVGIPKPSSVKLHLRLCDLLRQDRRNRNQLRMKTPPHHGRIDDFTRALRLVPRLRCHLVDLRALIDAPEPRPAACAPRPDRD